jgi:hypothetical protein
VSQGWLMMKKLLVCSTCLWKHNKVPVQSPSIKKQTKSANTSRGKKNERSRELRNVLEKLQEFGQLQLPLLFNQSHSTIDMFTIDSFKLLFRNAKKIVAEEEEKCARREKKMLTKNLSRNVYVILSPMKQKSKDYAIFKLKKVKFFFVGF